MERELLEQVQQLGQEDNSLFQLTGHADAAKSSTFVNTSALILARVGFALVDVHLAPTAFEARGTVTSVGTSNVDAGPTVFARRACIDEIKKLTKLRIIEEVCLTFVAFVDIVVTFRSSVTARTSTSV